MSKKSLITLFITVIVLVLVGGLYGFAYYGLSTATAKVEKLQGEIDTKGFQLERISRGRTELETLAADEAEVSQYIIGKEDVVPFLETLQSGGRALGTKIEVLSVSDAPVAGHPRIALSLTITGTFDAVMRTLGSIEYGPYDGVLTNLTLDTSGPDAKGVTTWTAASVFSLGVRPVATTTKSKP